MFSETLNARSKRERDDFEGTYSPVPACNHNGAGPCMKKQCKERFTWTQDLHAAFVGAIFDSGLRSASPKDILQSMIPTIGTEITITLDHIKSHLQKYRKSFQKKRDETVKCFSDACTKCSIHKDEDESKTPAHNITNTTDHHDGSLHHHHHGFTTDTIGSLMSLDALVNVEDHHAVLPSYNLSEASMDKLLEYQHNLLNKQQLLIQQVANLHRELHQVNSVQQMVHGRIHGHHEQSKSFDDFGLDDDILRTLLE